MIINKNRVVEISQKGISMPIIEDTCLVCMERIVNAMKSFLNKCFSFASPGVLKKYFGLIVLWIGQYY